MKINDLGSYRDFLCQLMEADYQFVSFPEQSAPTGEVIMRHDIDFDTGFARQAAETEQELGIQATYFFLMRSHFYNLLAPENLENVKAIQEMGHRVSIHFDPMLYSDSDFRAGLIEEVGLFEHLFHTKVETISLHRPNPFFLDFDETIEGIEHTYQKKYFKNIKYFADSRGLWRYGHPFDSEEFAAKKTLHILVHPIWWMIDEASNLDKLKHYFDVRVEGLRQAFGENCIPFRQLYEHA